MNDEIKEILYKMEDISYNYKANFLELHYKDVKILLDYITNLQEENERLKELNVCVGCNSNPDYKSRIDKAIEYIEEHVQDDEGCILKVINKYIAEGNNHFLDNLLNILQGSDKDDIF